jgi:hypothetical protein
MGFWCAAAAWVHLERGYPSLDVRTGGVVVVEGDLVRVAPRTVVWLGQARKYGFA